MDGCLDGWKDRWYFRIVPTYMHAYKRTCTYISIYIYMRRHNKDILKKTDQKTPRDSNIP